MARRRFHPCVRCQAPTLPDRDHCCRCRRRLAEQAAKQTCSGCGKQRVLVDGTDVCILCGRRCQQCGGPVRRAEATLCRPCRLRAEREAAKQPCPRCGRPGLLREETGWCGTCSRPRQAKSPPRECVVCGELRRHCGNGMCARCWQRHPDRPLLQAERIIARLDQPPEWLAAFAVFAADRHCPGRACRLLSGLERLLAEGPASNQALLERARRPGRSMGTLARTLEAFLTGEGLAFGLDQPARLAAGRRQRRIDATPKPLREPVARFAGSLLHARARAVRAGTRPRSDSTIESSLAVVRDFGRFLDDECGVDDWAAVSTAHVERFLSLRPACAARHSGALRQFFRWARRQRLVLVDPTRDLDIGRVRGFRGQTLTLGEQRRLFRRWTKDPGVHPHECLVGMLAMLHAATSTELRNLRVADLDQTRRTLRVRRRPQPVPLDPATWQALQRCLEQRASLDTHNPHLLVTRATKTRDTPASPAYLAHVLDDAGVNPKTLRSTRLVDLVVSLDPKLVAAAFGVSHDGVIDYMPDHVDEARLPSNL
jgi:site-specific recombinase XerD